MTSTSYHQRSSRVPDPTTQGNVRLPAAAGPSKSSNLHRESRKQKPTPFDPDDLCRRLQIVLAEEKAYAERKRRSRANIDRASTHPLSDEDASRKGREVPLEVIANRATASKSAQVTAARRSVLSKRRSQEPPSDPNPLPQPPEKDDFLSYHHVPRVAASQFERTTTHEPAKDNSLVHKLSKRAMRFHMESPNVQAELKDDTAPDKRARALHRVREEREKTYGRNQFQHPAALLEASEDVDNRQNHDPAYRHTLDTYYRTKQSNIDEGDWNANPRRSTSSARAHQIRTARESFDFPVGVYPILTQESAEGQEAPVRVENHRVDWTQSDEKPTEPLSPVLRKADSRWTLRGRLSFHRTGKSEKDMLVSEDRVASPALQPQRSSFFARFKR